MTWLYSGHISAHSRVVIVSVCGIIRTRPTRSWIDEKERATIHTIAMTIFERDLVIRAFSGYMTTQKRSIPIAMLVHTLAVTDTICI